MDLENGKIKMRIGFPTKPTNHGGPGSFQRRFEAEIIRMGGSVVYPWDNIRPDVIIVLGSTRKIFWLLKSRTRGIPVFFRLGGINWLYRIKKRSVTEREFISLKIKFIPLIQRLVGSGIVYQSSFSKKWLLKLGQSAKLKKSAIIYNGVNTNLFKRTEKHSEKISILCIEGNIDYSPYAIELLNFVQQNLIEQGEFHSLLLYGNFEKKENIKKLDSDIDYRGVVSRDKLPEIYRDAVYLSLDVNAACPNTVIEALASGIPVIGFDTGALKEIVKNESGIIVPFGADPWKQEFPKMEPLVNAANSVLANFGSYSANAAKLAKKEYNVSKMVDNYLSFLSTK